MKTKIRIRICVLACCMVFLSGDLLAQRQVHDTLWNLINAKKWFLSGTWKDGLKMIPFRSLNLTEFARQYHKNNAYWTKVITFLKNNNTDTLAPGKYVLDGSHVFVSVTSGPTKNFDATRWEAHKKYIDVQYVASGEEKIGMAQVSAASVVTPYNAVKDIGFYKVPEAKASYFLARPGIFFIFFPGETHRPGIKTGACTTDKKIVIKVEYAP